MLALHRMAHVRCTTVVSLSKVPASACYSYNSSNLLSVLEANANNCQCLGVIGSGFGYRAGRRELCLNLVAGCAGLRRCRFSCQTKTWLQGKFRTFPFTKDEDEASFILRFETFQELTGCRIHVLHKAKDFIQENSLQWSVQEQDLGIEVYAAAVEQRCNCDCTKVVQA